MNKKKNRYKKFRVMHVLAAITPPKTTKDVETKPASQPTQPRQDIEDSFRAALESNCCLNTWSNYKIP